MNESGKAPLPIERLDYPLPPELIAHAPAEPRDSARMLVVRRSDGSLVDRVFRDLPTLFTSGDLLVVNDTRVLSARLHALRATGGRVELLLLARESDGLWKSLARPSRKLRPGERLTLLDNGDQPTSSMVEVQGPFSDGVIVRFDDDRDIERFGRVPLPPYIQEGHSHPERYQTVYSRETGSAAAPTAGLHFTAELIEQCRAAGLALATVTLHVGLDTFQPIRVENARDHPIHSEWFNVPAETIRAIREARLRGSRVVAVGTTSVRTLEAAADQILDSDDAAATSGHTSLFITPGYQFRVVNAMVTNFHLPRTSLLLLVSAFAGEGLMKRAYEHAIDRRYRFYSFGDASLLL